MQRPALPLAIEGLPFMLFSGFATLILALLGWAIPSLAGLVLTAFVTAFFRDPVRIPPQDPEAIVCPADGKVIRIEEIDDQRFLEARVRRISIFMNVFNVHVNRIPYGGTVERVTLFPGTFVAADKDKAALHNEQCALVLAAADGQRYATVQIAGLIARRIVCRTQPGDAVRAGERFGLIHFGSRVDLYLPMATRITTRVGQRVRAGETTLGLWAQAPASEAESVA